MAACAMLANGALASSICRASPAAPVSASSVCFFFSPFQARSSLSFVVFGGFRVFCSFFVMLVSGGRDVFCLLSGRLFFRERVQGVLWVEAMRE
jgi:hypothetical protein